MDLELKDRVYIVTGGARGLGRATADVLAADGAKVVISGRSAESLAEAAASLGEAAVTVEADNADPRHPGPAHRGRAGGLRPARRGAHLGRRAADGHGVEHVGRGLVEGLRRRCSSGRSASLARCAPCSSPAARSPSCCRRRCARRSPAWPSPTACGPGLAMVAKTLADEAGPARRARQRAAARPRRHRAGRRARRVDRRRRGRQGEGDRADPAGPLRRAGGVRPGGGLPALARGVVRHRRRCCRSTAACCARSDPGCAGRVAARPATRRRPGRRSRRRPAARRTTTAGRRRSAGRCRGRAARPSAAAVSGAGSSLARSTKPP